MNKREINKIKKEISKIINENGSKVFFTGGIIDESILEIENTLNVRFPDSYKWFLKEYGQGSFFAVEIFGAKIKLQEESMCIKYTETARRDEGLPEEYVVIEDVGEWSYCMDTSNMKNRECPIIQWDPIYGEVIRVKNNNFCEFFHERIREMM